MGPLNGIKVLDLSQDLISGSFCTLMMSDLGAEVIKIETPEGDPIREVGPEKNGKTLGYTNVNRGKKSMILDLNNEQQKSLFKKMIADVDVIVDSFKPGTMEGYGLGFEEMKKINPKIIWTSVTPFGQFGPWSKKAGDDLTVQAAGGLMSMVGEMGGKSTKVGFPIGEQLGGFYSCIGTIAALNGVLESGEGCRVDVSMMDSVIAAMEQPYARYDLLKVIPKPLGNKHASCVPMGDFTCKDGKDLVVNISTDVNFAAFCEVLGAPELPEDIRFKYTYERVKNRDVVESKMRELFSQHDSDYLVEGFTRVNAPHSRIYTVKDVIETEHIQSRQMIGEVTYSDGTTLKCINTPFRMSDMDIKTNHMAAELGENTIEIASQYLTEEEIHTIFG